MPCIWISSRTHAVYWPEGSYFEPYRPEKLRELCEMAASTGIEPWQSDGRRLPLLSLGMRLRRNYLRKYKAGSAVIDAEEDRILREDFRLEGHCAPGETMRQTLLAHFRSFDRSAIELNERYQAVLYWRAILPFITTLFVAVGFYASSVLAALPLPLSARFWGIVGGVGFLIHGFLNLYVFLLSRSKTIKDWHRGFLRDRYIAELLRVLLHFAPFGIHLDLRRLCGENQELCMAVRRLTEDTAPGAREVTRDNVREAFVHIDEMLADQISYHTVSQRRYSGIVTHLERWGRCAFFIGFIVVLLRAGLQFAMSFLTLPDMTLGAGVRLSSFVSSGANMAALLLPAWYSFFAAKLGQCNFRFNRDNHQRMLEQLLQERERINTLRESFDELPVEALSALGENLAEIMLVSDTSAWVRKYESATIQHL